MIGIKSSLLKTKLFYFISIELHIFNINIKFYMFSLEISALSQYFDNWLHFRHDRPAELIKYKQHVVKLTNIN